MGRLYGHYKEQVIPKLMSQYSLANINQAPKILKVVVNMGVGEAITSSTAIDSAVADLAAITGQKPSLRRARKSIAAFKLRAGIPIGVAVTLRKDRMYEFLDRLINVALPRVRDFKGVSRRSFDGLGNYSFGLSEQIVFPEIDMDKTEIRGLSITVVTTAGHDGKAEFLLEKMGFPFRGPARY